MTTSTKRFKFSFLLATFFGVGLFPVAPGTLGSLASLPLAFGLLSLSLEAALLVIAVIFVIGVLASNAVEADLGSHDAKLIVIDEVVGQCLVVVLLEAFLPGLIDVMLLLVLSFLGFRLFDIAKPWPVGWVDSRVQGGFGVMLDDVVAALLAVLFLAGNYFAYALLVM
jgi:phosphatidylglycerophosphatase A